MHISSELGEIYLVTLANTIGIVKFNYLLPRSDMNKVPMRLPYVNRDKQMLKVEQAGLESVVPGLYSVVEVPRGRPWR